MPVVTLPDGSQRTFDAPVTVFDVAADIGAGLAKAALAGVVDGREVDTSHVIEGDTELHEIEGLNRLRISSIEPNLLHPEIIDLVASSNTLQPHFHMHHKALQELDDQLRTYDPSDPIKYDFALFGL